MIRGPILPQLRDSLWALVSSRLERIESGLQLVLEGFDCSDGQVGMIDGLARDAIGAPVLIMVAVEGDALLPSRALAASRFLQRVGDGLVEAVPEANYCAGASGRILLVGTEAAVGPLAQVVALAIPRLQACTLEPFRIAGSERFAVRWLPGVAVDAASSDGAERVAVASSDDAFVVPEQAADQWQLLQGICSRIDSAVAVAGDRYLRRITWSGRPLGEVRIDDGMLVGSASDGAVFELHEARDVRRFGDRLLRAYLRHAGIELSIPTAVNSSMSMRAGLESADARFAAPRHAASDRMLAPKGESLRTSLAAARLSPEEYSALEDPASLAGDVRGGNVVADGRQQASPSGSGSPERD